MTTRTVGFVRRGVAVGGLLASTVSLAVAAAPANEAATSDAKRTLTFNKDVAPVLFANCTSCHRPGEVAPFPLLTYRDVQKRSELIRDVTSARTMPPWKAVSGFGHFAGERRLNDE